MSRVLSRLSDSGWHQWQYRSVTVDARLGKLSRTMFLKTHDYEPGAINRVCEVISNADIPVFTGYLVDVLGNHNAGYTYVGVSLTHNLVMNDATNSVLLKGLPIWQVLQSICSRVAVPLDSFNTTFTNPIAKFRVKRGQQYAKALQDMVQARRLVLTDNGFGEASLMTLEDESPSRTVEAGHGAVQGEIDLQLRMSKLYASYLVRGQRELLENEVDEKGLTLLAGAVTGLTERNTTKVFPAKSTTTKLDAQQYTEWQAKMALAAAYKVKLVLSDWDTGVGDIVSVFDDLKGIDEDFVVETVQFTDTPTVFEQSKLALTLPEAFSFRPLKPATPRRNEAWQIKKRASRGLKVELNG